MLSIPIVLRLQLLEAFGGPDAVPPPAAVEIEHGLARFAINPVAVRVLAHELVGVADDNGEAVTLGILARPAGPDTG